MATLDDLAKKLGIVMRFFFFIDYHIKILLKVRLRLIFGKTVICDRYFYDLLMELRRSGLITKEFTVALAKTLPRPLIIFLLDVPEGLVSQRRGFTSKEIRAKRKIFLDMAKIFGFSIIDTSSSFINNQKRIRDLTVTYIAMRRKNN